MLAHRWLRFGGFPRVCGFLTTTARKKEEEFRSLVTLVRLHCEKLLVKVSSLYLEKSPWWLSLNRFFHFSSCRLLKCFNHHNNYIFEETKKIFVGYGQPMLAKIPSNNNFSISGLVFVVVNENTSA